MKRFILSGGPDKNGKIRLEGRDYHYLVRVRRLAPGEIFPALLPGGGEVLVRVLSSDGGVLTGDCLSAESAGAAQSPGKGRDAQTPDSGALPPIILFQSLPKSEKMDLIVRQAAEGGLAEIVPFSSEFSIPKIKNGGEKKGPPARQARWERIVKEARQQSGSSVATAVRPPLGIDALFAYWEDLKSAHPGALGILFHHMPLENASLHGYLEKDPEIVALAIGPEGGFSPAEAERFLEAGFKPLTLGGSVLRTETAALYGAAAIRIILLEKNSWEIRCPRHGNG
ncbi:MAG: 16S rRNA (uracil(1498)-N(3))-methyltransferase [Treponema sp.]|nr:16S rRNA (uracil(1498)-N(3))-methyltransferase [Treponema sp.]